MIKLRIPFTLFFFTFIGNAFAQTEFSANTWDFIDSTMAKKRNLNDLILLLNDLEKKADTQKDYFNYARCLNYKMAVLDIKTEDTFYFKNSAFIDSLLLQKQPAALNYALHIILANRLTRFQTKYKNFNQNRYERKDVPVNYAVFSNRELTNIALQYLENAKALTSQINKAEINDALWLSADPLQFLFKPTLFDIAIAEQISITKENSYNRSPVLSTAFNWIGLTQDAFIQKLDSLQYSENKDISKLRLYSSWLSHNKENKEAYYFIETLARKYIYELMNQAHPETQIVYENYLRVLLNSEHTTVKAHAVYQLCLLLNKQGGRYFQLEMSWNYGYNGSKLFDTTYRFKPAEALALFKENSHLLDSFLYLKNILLLMERKIEEVDLQISLEANNLPGQPMLAELKFKNVEKLFYRILRIDQASDFVKNEIRDDTPDFLNRKPLIEDSILLPASHDYNNHNTYLKFDALPVGKYLLFFSDKGLADTTAIIRRVDFSVTSIAVLNNGKRIYVINRKTGLPLTGANVKAGYTSKIKKDNVTTIKFISSSYVVNKNGYIHVQNPDYDEIIVVNGNDTVSQKIKIEEPGEPEDIYNKDDYDDLVDYYETEAKAYIYTDRSIYRPGQTVYYKAIFLTKNRKSGDLMLMNKKNLKGKLLSNVYKKWLKESEPLLLITDPFRKQMDSVKIKLNDFGSVSGSFKIPKTAATGEWSIEPDYIDVDWQYGRFRVEEYKRPSYEISIGKPKKELHVNDGFSFTVKVKSFAGAVLNNVRIDYNVRCTFSSLEFDSLQKRFVNVIKTDTILKATGNTNADGVLEILVKDSVAEVFSFSRNKNAVFNYSLDAEAIDATGESYSERAEVTISAQPVNIKLPIANQLNREELPQLLITATDKNAGTVSKNISIKFYSLTTGEKLHVKRTLMAADEWLYSVESLKEWFPLVNFKNEERKPVRKLIWETIVNTALQQKLVLPKMIFTAGNYIAEASCEESGSITGEVSKAFKVFDPVEGKMPEQTWNFGYLSENSMFAGDSLKYFYGSAAKEVFSIFHITYYSAKKKLSVENIYQQLMNTASVHAFKMKIPEDAVGTMKITHIFIINNELFNTEERIFITNRKKIVEPEIIVEKYRKSLAPGSKETFTVSVKTQNENIAAELMTTMYDASLDKLEKHRWEMPREKGYPYINTNWDNNINSYPSSKLNAPFYRRMQSVGPAFDKRQPLWWMNPQDYTYSEIVGNLNSIYPEDINYFLSGKVSGINISSTAGLQEVVVTTAFGMKTMRMQSASVVVLRGSASLSSYSQPLVILDGVIYEGDLSKIDPLTITQGLVLKGADASAIYGARAADGVLILSTKGNIVFPTEPEPVIIPRKNFNESAFFFPDVHIDRNGLFSFSFTMPESVTEWNWKLLAHTKLAKFVYAEKKLTTQLPLMVQPNVPRLLYQGDRIILQSRISNLDTLAADGKITCNIEDVITGNDITTQLLAVNHQIFSLNKKENKSAAFEITIPVQQLNPIKVIVKVSSANFTDGEEHIIPVFSPKVFVSESKDFYFQNSADTVLQMPPLPNDAQFYGTAVTINPKPQAALLNSLPWLANYPYDCAEQVFNKLLANATALKMMRTDKNAQAAFKAAKEFTEQEKNIPEELPNELNEETMPWLNKANQSVLLKKQLFNLLDTSKTKSSIEDLLQKLYKLQNADGGLAWFNGGESNDYISNYLLKGFGLMNKDSLYFPASIGASQQTKFMGSLINYADQHFMRIFNGGKRDKVSLLQYVYARSFWQKENPVNDSLLKPMMSLLLSIWKNADGQSLYNQALLIITSMRFANGDNDLISKASAQLNSIRQRAIEDDQNGLRWKELADADDLNTSSEETIALISEAFATSATDKTIDKGIVKWLLTAKDEHRWGSTKATAAAINLLFKNNASAIGETQTLSAFAGGNKLLLTDDLLTGDSYKFYSSNVASASIKLAKEKDIPASGNIITYYFTSDSSLNRLNRDVQLEKKFYKWNNSSNDWDLINAKTVLKIADKVKVVLTLVTSRALPFVFVNDKRAAAFEPADNESGYEYGSGFSYYKSVRDAGYDFFAENIPSGKHEISYEIKVSQEGSFTSGPAVLQCMYKPAVNAYSNTLKVNVER